MSNYKSNTANAIVSCDSEELILVDEQDRETGFRSKGECHDGDGVLHRAFSVFVFDKQNRLLIQKRSADKRLWPMFWSNTCCSHPRRGESMEYATNRRLMQELGLSCDLEFQYKFKYQAQYEDLGSEHELCWVYIGTSSSSDVTPNETEVAEVRWISIDDLDEELLKNPEHFTPWFKLEWAEIRKLYQ